jgi:hypothetical protein
VPHPGGGTLGDNLFPDALWSRAEALARMDVDAIASHLEVVEIPGAGHNIRGDRAGRARYLELLTGFLDRV